MQGLVGIVIFPWYSMASHSIPERSEVGRGLGNIGTEYIWAPGCEVQPKG